SWSVAQVSRQAAVGSSGQTAGGEEGMIELRTRFIVQAQRLSRIPHVRFTKPCIRHSAGDRAWRGKGSCNTNAARWPAAGCVRSEPRTIIPPSPKSFVAFDG